MLKLFRASRANRDLRRAIKSILGFCPGNIFLYRLAFRHRSASKVLNGVRRNNERLEYLGDAVLSVVIAEYLFKKYPTQDEGFLTEMRSKIVSRASLNKVGLHMGLHKMIQLDQGHGSGGFKSVDGDALEYLMFTCNVVDVTVYVKIAVFAGKFCRRFSNDVLVVNAAIVGKRFYSNIFYTKLFCKREDFFAAHHSSIVVHNFAANAALFQTRKSAQIHGGFGVPRAN